MSTPAPRDMRPGPGPLYGPEFSSFRPDEVGWLLADYTHLSLEREVDDRERDIQSGRSHYADDLPRERAPTQRYTDLFDDALLRSADAVAAAVARAGDEINRRLPLGEVVLVSLARAGVPAGVWLQHRLTSTYGRPSHHYAISIVRDRGADPHALTWIAAHHDPERVVFVDGWSGKGTMRAELSKVLRGRYGRVFTSYPDRLAVIADPAGAADIAGTADDILIPTACLNSTSCGLVSRTVLPRSGASSSPYHGARLYWEHADFDRSRQSVEVINHRVDLVPPTEPLLHRAKATAPRTPWTVAARLGIVDVNLVKPGIGETTRVLQRRTPWKVLVHPDWMHHPDLHHIHALAADRRAEVIPADTSPYRCIGVVRPQREGALP